MFAPQVIKSGKRIKSLHQLAPNDFVALESIIRRRDEKKEVSFTENKQKYHQQPLPGFCATGVCVRCNVFAVHLTKLAAQKQNNKRCVAITAGWQIDANDDSGKRLPLLLRFQLWWMDLFTFVKCTRCIAANGRTAAAHVASFTQARFDHFRAGRERMVCNTVAPPVYAGHRYSRSFGQGQRRWGNLLFQLVNCFVVFYAFLFRVYRQGCLGKG